MEGLQGPSIFFALMVPQPFRTAAAARAATGSGEPTLAGLSSGAGAFVGGLGAGSAGERLRAGGGYFSTKIMSRRSAWQVILLLRCSNSWLSGTSRRLMTTRSFSCGVALSQAAKSPRNWPLAVCRR